MLNKPSLDQLLNVVDSRYSLVVAAAKRSRHLLEGATAKIDCPSTKFVTIALEEINAGLITYQPTKTGIK